jgi:transposase
MSTVTAPPPFRAAVLRHLPLIRHAIGAIGIDQVLSEQLPPDPRNRVTDADCVTLMIENVLHGRVALYNMNGWLQAVDTDVVLGEGCDPSAFTDDRLAAALDHIYEYGTDDLLSAVVRGYFAQRPGPGEYSVHTDTTTLMLWGDYDQVASVGGPMPRRGHSKDRRPDLKQLVYGLSLHGAVGIPLCVSVLDGNTSDHAANRFHIDELAGLLPPEDDVTLVADCKLCDPTTLGRVLDANFRFVTLVPRSYKLRGALVERILQREQTLPDLFREPGETKADPEHVYGGVSFVEPFEVLDPESGEKKLLPLRFLVVESSELARRFEESLGDKLRVGKVRFEKAARRLASRKYRCEPDARIAIERFQRGNTLHTATWGVEEVTKALPRAQRGRPKAGEVAATETFWRVTWADTVVDQAAVEHARARARFFVLATDHVEDEGWDDKRILAEYRHQHIIEGHTGFRWLKGPAAVAPMFLKTPERIAALGLVFVLALMVRNWLQWEVRQRLAEQGEKLPNMNKRPTTKPTTENVFHYFEAVTIVLVYRDGKVAERHVCNLTGPALRSLQILGIDPAIFTTPPKFGRPQTGSAE